MKRKAITYPFNKKKKVKIVYIPRRGGNFFNKKIIFISVFILFALISMISFSVIYFDTKARINRHLKQEELKEALILIEQMLNKNPYDPYALKIKGKIYFLMISAVSISKQYKFTSKQYDRYIDNCITALTKLGSKNKKKMQSDDYFFLGCSYFLLNTKDYDYKALTFLQKSLSLNKNDHQVDGYINSYGLALRLNGKLEPKEIAIFGLLGYLTHRMGRYQTSLNYFKKAVKNKGSSAIYHLIMAVNYYELKLYKKAVGELEILNEIEKEADILERSYSLLGKIFLTLKEYEQAEKYIMKAQQYKKTAEKFYQLGKIFQIQNQTSKAIRFWKNAIKLDPNHSGAIRQLMK